MSTPAKIPSRPASFTASVKSTPERSSTLPRSVGRNLEQAVRIATKEQSLSRKLDFISRPPSRPASDVRAQPLDDVLINAYTAPLKVETVKSQRVLSPKRDSVKELMYNQVDPSYSLSPQTNIQDQVQKINHQQHSPFFDHDQSEQGLSAIAQLRQLIDFQTRQISSLQLQLDQKASISEYAQLYDSVSLLDKKFKHLNDETMVADKELFTRVQGLEVYQTQNLGNLVEKDQLQSIILDLKESMDRNKQSMADDLQQLNEKHQLLADSLTEQKVQVQNSQASNDNQVTAISHLKDLFQQIDQTVQQIKSQIAQESAERTAQFNLLSSNINEYDRLNAGSINLINEHVKDLLQKDQLRDAQNSSNQQQQSDVSAVVQLEQKVELLEKKLKAYQLNSQAPRRGQRTDLGVAVKVQSLPEFKKSVQKRGHKAIVHSQPNSDIQEPKNVTVEPISPTCDRSGSPLVYTGDILKHYQDPPTQKDSGTDKEKQQDSSLYSGDIDELLNYGDRYTAQASHVPALSQDQEASIPQQPTETKRPVSNNRVRLQRATAKAQQSSGINRRGASTDNLARKIKADTLQRTNSKKIGASAKDLNKQQ